MGHPHRNTCILQQRQEIAAAAGQVHQDDRFLRKVFGANAGLLCQLVPPRQKGVGLGGHQRCDDKIGRNSEIVQQR